jgi:PD-(D/E)XK endonuclease/Protein of unknown function (DUF2442)
LEDGVETGDGSEAFCWECGKDIDPRERGRRFCSSDHRRTFNGRRFGRRLEKSEIGREKGKIGSINELRVVIDLFQKGYDVFRAANPTALDDLWIKRDDRLLRVQIKTGHLQEKNIIFSGRRRPEWHCDVLAIPLDNGEIQYDPPNTSDWGKREPATQGKRTVKCELRIEGRRIVSAEVEEGKIKIELKNKTRLEVPLGQFPELSGANHAAVTRVVTPYGGRTVRWPALSFEKTAEELFRGN